MNTMDNIPLMDVTVLAPNRQFSFTRHRPPKTKPGAEPWTPVELRLPDTYEQIEAGRPEPEAVERDNSREARIERLLGSVPGVTTGDTIPTPRSKVLLRGRRESIPPLSPNYSELREFLGLQVHLSG